MIHRLDHNIEFPDVKLASDDGLLAIGGDLSPNRLIKAYEQGIFPWYNANDPILWWSPDPRFVLFPEKLKVSKSLKQLMRNHSYKITFNTNFKAVMTECAHIKRKGQNGTWIHGDMIESYYNLFKLGKAKSVEVWKDDELVGGLYGVDLGKKVFCGESMFAKEKNASKIGFLTFIEASNYKLIDCQVYTAHLERMGAEEIKRSSFIELLK